MSLSRAAPGAATEEQETAEEVKAEREAKREEKAQKGREYRANKAATDKAILAAGEGVLAFAGHSPDPTWSMQLLLHSTSALADSPVLVPCSAWGNSGAAPGSRGGQGRVGEREGGSQTEEAKADGKGEGGS
jgi:hypothetical protein